MLVHRAKMIDVECVARGYISGSGWKDYRRDGRICGIALPPGLRESDRLPGPIFTPATKAQSGHDENISFETAASQMAIPWHIGSASSHLRFTSVPRTMLPPAVSSSPTRSSNSDLPVTN